MQPAEVFFYVFLPPLLLDSAVRVDYFLFKKVICGGWKGRMGLRSGEGGRDGPQIRPCGSWGVQHLG